jgi:hypothetical protein
MTALSPLPLRCLHCYCQHLFFGCLSIVIIIDMGGVGSILSTHGSFHATTLVATHSTHAAMYPNICLFIKSWS